MQDAHGNQWHLHLLPDRNIETDWQKKYHPTDTINNSANRPNNPKKPKAMATSENANPAFVSTFYKEHT